MVRMETYGIKVDDVLLHFLKEYHDVDASDAMSFFTDRVNEMKMCEPNITDKSRPSTIGFKTLEKRTVQVPWAKNRMMRKNNPYSDPQANFYVLRGFYPETHIPFKMTVVRATTQDAYGIRSAGDVLHCKVIMGMKPHFSTFNSGEVNKYKNHVAEATLLDAPVDPTTKVKYQSREFKCMRPKGMDLYREVNYEEKRKEKARIAYRKRKEKKND